MSTKEIVEISKELIDLSKNKPVSGDVQLRVKDLMSRLREMSFTNKEVSAFTKGEWAQHTVKLYTRGVKVKDSALRERVLSLLSDLVSKGSDLDDVESFLKLSNTVESKDITFEDTSDLLADCNRQNVNPKDLVSLFKERMSKGTVSKLKSQMSYLDTLESYNIVNDDIQSLSQTTQKIGSFKEVLGSVEKYGELVKIQAEHDTVSEKVKNLNAQKDELTKDVSKLKNDKTELVEQRRDVLESVKKYENLVKRGFTDDVISSIQESLNQFGSLNKTLSAISRYTDVKVIESEKNRVEKELKNIQTKYSDIQPVMKMCDTLIHKYGYSVATINLFHKLAAKHENPYEFIKILSAYGDLNSIQNEAKRIEAEKTVLAAKIKVLEDKIGDLKGEADGIKTSINKALKPMSAKLSAGITSLHDKVDESVSSLTGKCQENLNDLEKKYKEYLTTFGELKAEAGKLEEELNLARVISSMLKYPEKAKKLPLRYVILLQEAVEKICSAYEINPKLSIYGAGSLKTPGLFEVEMLSLINKIKFELRLQVKRVELNES